MDNPHQTIHTLKWIDLVAQESIESVTYKTSRIFHNAPQDHDAISKQLQALQSLQETQR